MKKRLQALLLALCLTLGTISAGCGGRQDNNAAGTETAAATETEKTASVEDSAMAKANAGELNIIDDKYRTYYEVFLYSFYDSDGDGIGDIQGLIDKLDYINDGDDSTDTDLGCNGIWLMPIMPSPTYHKYDISDYENIDEQYGTIDDFKQLIEACHKRGIRVIIDFPINHTSSKHPWFTQAVEYLEGLSDGQQQIQSAFETYGVKDYVVLQKGNVKIAVVGVFGKDALKCAPTCELIFKDPVEAVKQTVEEIKKNEDVDMIACVSHGGTWEDESKSEDEILAKAVPDIDLIISGHSHTELKTAICHGDTYVVSCGEYGRNLGSLSMTQKADGRWELTDYTLIPVSSDVEPDQATQERINALMDTVDTNYLADFGYTREEVLAENAVEFNSLDEMGTKHEELNLGDIMSDAYIYAVENSEYFDGDPVDVAVVPSGTVRDTYTKGNLTVEDIFNSFSLGIGKDGVPGYPLIDAYLTGKELKLAAEVDASISDFMTTARLYCSGLNFTYNPNRMILNKVTDCYLTRKDGERIEIQDDQLYHVVTDLYTGQMLGSVMDLSYGLLSLQPKDKDGHPIENLEDYAIMEGDRELKAWDAIARYMQSFDDTDGDGIANVPEYYAATHGRKVVDDSKNIIDLVKHPNKFSAIIIMICLIVVVIIVLVIVLIRKLVRKARK